MNSNNIVFSTIAIMVCVVLIGCCLVPIVQDSVVGRDVTHEVTYTNEITGSKSVYRLASGDTITVDLSGYTVNAGGVDYTSTDDLMLIDPEYGLVVPDYSEFLVNLYEDSGIQQILGTGATIVKIKGGDETNTFVLTSDKKIWATGDNQYGQMGNGSNTSIQTFTDITPSGEEIIDFDVYVGDRHNSPAGGRSLYLLTSENRVLSSGLNTSGQLGNGTTNNSNVFIDVTPNGKTINGIYASESTCYLLTSDKEIWATGGNQYGQIADGTTDNCLTFKDITPNGKNIEKISCDGSTCCIYTSDGVAMGTGMNIYGQLGAGDSANKTSFITMSIQDKTISDVFCSTNNVRLITSDGELWAAGSNQYGELGVSGSNSDVFKNATPQNTTIKEISASPKTCFILTTDGKIMGTGYNSNGQIADGTTTNVKGFKDITPENVTVKKIFCSNSTTLIITDDDKIMVSGACGLGQLGTGSTTDQKSFIDTTPNDFTVSFAFCQSADTFIISMDRTELYVSGSNYYYQAGVAKDNYFNKTLETSLEPVVITYEDSNLTIGTEVIESQTEIYLISGIAALDTSGLIYIDSSDTPAEYYADPSSVLSFSAASDSFYIGQGAEILIGYDTTAALSINQGTATQASTIFTYSGASFPITATNVSGYSMLIDGSYTGTYTTHEGGTDNQMWAILATLTVTLTIIGVVLGAVRMIGGRE